VETQRTQQKLTTILAVDVEGYTRLMRANEEATPRTLTEYRDVIDGLIARHESRVFSTGGDGVLAEFGSAVEAVRCAISYQEEISSRNVELADDRRLMFRIGVNIGDVMVAVSCTACGALEASNVSSLWNSSSTAFRFLRHQLLRGAYWSCGTLLIPRGRKGARPNRALRDTSSH
jgi:hypothetical protein